MKCDVEGEYKDEALKEVLRKAEQLNYPNYESGEKDSGDEEAEEGGDLQNNGLNKGTSMVIFKMFGIVIQGTSGDENSSKLDLIKHYHMF